MFKYLQGSSYLQVFHDDKCSGKGFYLGYTVKRVTILQLPAQL
jgi:hypothetical protein